MLRSTAEIHAYQRKVFNETGRYARDPEPADLDAANLEANAVASRLLQRVLDDDLRERVRGLQRSCAEVTSPSSVRPESSDIESARAAEREFRDVARDAAHLEDRLGEVLRKLV